MSLSRQEQLMEDGELAARLRIAVMRVAVAVVGESIGTGELAEARRNKRHNLAVNTLNSVSRYMPIIARAVLSQGSYDDNDALVPTISAASTDAEIEDEISEIWNSVAGVNAEEAATE